jgi:hypothetical protein
MTAQELIAAARKRIEEYPLTALDVVKSDAWYTMTPLEQLVFTAANLSIEIDGLTRENEKQDG